jgi:hypothetical protein
VIWMIRSIPRRAWSRLSWASMKHTSTYAPGLAMIFSCWKASCDSGPANPMGSPAMTFSRPFFSCQQSVDDLLGVLLALDLDAKSICTRKPSFSKPREWK